MKKIVALIVFALLLISVTSLITFAQTETAEEEVTLLTRIFEFWEENRTEIVSAVGSGINLVILAFTGKALTKRSDHSLPIIGNIATATKSLAGSQGQMITAVNRMTETAEALDKTNKRYSESEEERLATEGRLIAAIMTLLRIETLALSNNKNLPLSIKEQVGLEYASFLKLAGEDKSIAELMKRIEGGEKQ